MLKSARSLFSTHTGEGVANPNPSSSKSVAQLKPEHFVVEPSNLRYPSTLDFSHACFKLRDVSLLEAVPRG